MSTAIDNVNHPAHYTSDPSGVECIEVTRHRSFNIGNAMKYLWRNGLKDEDAQVEDLQKAIWYINDEIKRLKSNKDNVGKSFTKRTNIAKPLEEIPECSSVAIHWFTMPDSFFTQKQTQTETDTNNCNCDDQSEILPLPKVETFPWDDYKAVNYVVVDSRGFLMGFTSQPQYIDGGWYPTDISEYCIFLGSGYLCENPLQYRLERPKKTEIEADDLNNHVAPTTKISTIDATKNPCGGGCLYCVCQGGA